VKETLVTITDGVNHSIRCVQARKIIRIEKIAPLYEEIRVEVFAALNVLLIGIVVALGFREKKVLQRLAEL